MGEMTNTGKADKSFADRVAELADKVAAGSVGRGTRVYRDFVQIARANGYEGKHGGWILDKFGNVVVQGWQSFAQHIAEGRTHLLSINPDAEPAPARPTEPATPDLLAQESDERFAVAAGDRLSMAVTPSGARKIAEHLAARRSAPPAPCPHPSSARQRPRDVWHPDVCGACGETLPDADKTLVTPTDHANALARRIVEVLSVEQPPPADPVTEDTVPELVDRIVRRAQYEALKTFRTVLSDSVEIAEENCRSMHEGTHDVRDCSTFTPSDVALMIDAVAVELRVPKLVEQ